MIRLKQIGIDVDVNRAIEQQRRSFAESENDILRRVLLAPVADPPIEAPRWAPARDETISRSRGSWSVEVRGERRPAANLKEAYRTLLHMLSERFPDFLHKFAAEKSRSRRFVAASPHELYATSSSHLAADHGKPLKEGWYFDTNLSTEQVSRRARVAARLCGLRYGTEVRVLDNLREI